MLPNFDRSYLYPPLSHSFLHSLSFPLPSISLSHSLHVNMTKSIDIYFTLSCSPSFLSLLYISLVFLFHLLSHHFPPSLSLFSTHLLPVSPPFSFNVHIYIYITSLFFFLQSLPVSPPLFSTPSLTLYLSILHTTSLLVCIHPSLYIYYPLSLPIYILI